MITYVPDVRETVRRALAEDIGSGDITTLLTVPEIQQGTGLIVAKSHGVVAGLPVLQEVFYQVDPTLKVELITFDGATVQPGQTLATIKGNARSILTGERVALNFLQRLSGTASMTAHYVKLVNGTKARIVDTRKTTPGLRVLEKYAVRVGGGFNHRQGLYDAILIKDNHIAASGGINAAVESALAQASHTLTITVECDTLDQVREAVQAGVDMVLLDNMSPALLKEAIDIAEEFQVGTEASGGINEDTVAEIAATGIDIISVGALTHSAPSLDIGLDLSI